MSVHSWGTGKNGELGAGKGKMASLDPVVLEHFRGKRIRSVCCGEQHSLAVAEMGDVFVWGRGREGQLGNGEIKLKAEKPVRVTTLRHERVQHAVCGYYHCLAISTSGRLYQWGKLYRQIQGENKDAFGKTIGLSGLQNESLKKMLDRSHNQYYSAEATAEETEELKGLQNFGSFVPYVQPVPELVEELAHKRVVEIAAGYSFSIAITDDGEVYAWGFNDKFQLGLGHRYSQSKPQLIKSLQGIHIVAAACGQQHTVLLSSTGEVYTFGLGVFGQLGHVRTSDERRPRLVEALQLREQDGIRTGDRIVQVACGSHHTLALGVSGEVWTWGSAEYGQQGGTNAYEDWATGQRAGKAAALVCATPRSLRGCFDEKHISYIACGHLFNVALAKDGSVWTWGWGSYGVLGHGNHRFQLVPKQIRKLNGERILQVAGGSKHCLAVNVGSSTMFAFDFKVALNNPYFSDITFAVDGKIFQAHKGIVFPRSYYLRAYSLLFQRYRPVKKIQQESTSDLENIDEEETETFEEKEQRIRVEKKEKASKEEDKFIDEGHVLLKGIRHQVFAAVLFYLYTDHLKVAPHLIGDVRKAAKRFNLPRLEQICKQAQLSERDLSRSSKAISRFSEDLLEAVDDAFAADVAFLVSNEREDGTMISREIMAHKVILSARSDYFKKIFTGGFKESEREDEAHTTIPIPGIEPTIFIAMLQYIYTGRVYSKPADSTSSSDSDSDGAETNRESDIDPDIVVELLLAADRFLLDDLKQSCEASIERCLDHNNVGWMLELSDRASAPRLKRVCMEYIGSLFHNIPSRKEDKGKEKSFEFLESDDDSVFVPSPGYLKELGLSSSLNQELDKFLATFTPIYSFAKHVSQTQDDEEERTYNKSSSSSSERHGDGELNDNNNISGLPELVADDEEA